MHILLSNDDGYLAPGLDALATELRNIAEVTVVAPDRNRSGASNSLTLERPLRALRAENGFIKVDGTPTDCIHLAITGLLDKEPDMVVSGINAGANLGDDVLYSGTVAAAMEGRFMGVPSIAISLASSEQRHLATAVQVFMRVLAHLQGSTLSGELLLNINVPDLPLHELQGLQTTRLGHRHKAKPVVKAQDPRGDTIYWVGSAGSEQDAGPGTDFYAVHQGFVSITPIQLDLTHYDAIDLVEDWLQGMKL